MIAVVLALFVPIFVMSSLGQGQAAIDHTHNEEAVVGIAVILRATARRLLRTASGNVMRTTFATMTRASSRAATRQLIKFSTRIFAGSVVKDATGEARVRRRGVNLGVGLLALAASFYGVLKISGHGAAIQAYTGLGTAALSLLAAFPLLVYAGITLLAARLLGVKVSIASDLDGLILQGYFTGSGSFLPMTTDLIYEGDDASKARVATVSIAGLYVVHLLLALLAVTADIPFASGASSFCLIYCFVFAFPIRPLEGHEIWRRSRLRWLLIWTPILLSFIYALPAEFGAIL